MKLTAIQEQAVTYRGRNLQLIACPGSGKTEVVAETVVEELHQLGGGICVVGDDDQTIYQWRGSDVRNILNFENRYSGVTQVRLEENFKECR